MSLKFYVNNFYLRGLAALQNITTATPNGEFHIIFDEAGVARALGFGHLDDLARRLPEGLQGLAIEKVEEHPYEKLIEEYYRGNFAALVRIPRNQPGTDFQKKVWSVLESIPPSETISYKTLAERTGNPAAIRAAGSACGLNRLALLIPCHRVVKSDSRLGSYLYGEEIKRSLLAREGIVV